MAQITLHMVSSLDGFIAKKDGTVDWLQTKDNYENGVVLSDEQIVAYLAGIDAYVMGARTYEHALELGWPYGDKPVVVVSNRALKTDRPTVEFYAGDMEGLVKDLKSKFEHIWLVGGASLTKDFLRLRLVDEIIVSIMPIILGDGLLFFDYVGMEQELHLKNVTAYQDGMVELSYQIK